MWWSESYRRQHKQRLMSSHATPHAPSDFVTNNACAVFVNALAEGKEPTVHMR